MHRYTHIKVCIVTEPILSYIYSITQYLNIKRVFAYTVNDLSALILVINYRLSVIT